MWPNEIYRAQPVPYALHSMVAYELDWLETDGIITRVEFYGWVAPVVKPLLIDQSGSVVTPSWPPTRLSRVTLSYPLATKNCLLLVWRKNFLETRPHLYQQVQIDDDSRKYTTINTHQGLYCYKRLSLILVSHVPLQFSNVPWKMSCKACHMFVPGWYTCYRINCRKNICTTLTMYSSSG